LSCQCSDGRIEVRIAIVVLGCARTASQWFGILQHLKSNRWWAFDKGYKDCCFLLIDRCWSIVCFVDSIFLNKEVTGNSSVKRSATGILERTLRVNNRRVVQTFPDYAIRPILEHRLLRGLQHIPDPTLVCSLVCVSTTIRPVNL
jgi:hypothetical protein